MPTISGVMATLNGAHRIPKAIESMLPYIDELIVFIDDKTVDDSYDIAKQFTPKVNIIKHQGIIEYYFREMFSACSGDFILRLDDDETLTRINPAKIIQTLDQYHLSGLNIPRRWLVPPGDRFIATSPWYPDHQLRIIKNDDKILYSKMIHQKLGTMGKTAFTKDLHIHHFDFIYNSREQRDKKVKHYDEISNGNGMGDYYRYEDYLDRLTISRLPANPFAMN